MESECENPGIQLLPNELLLMVLGHTSIKDIVHFGSTCKQFNELIKDSHGLWKNKLKTTVSKTVYDGMLRNPNVSWYNHIQMFFNLKIEVFARIQDMAAFYFNCKTDITLDDVRKFFNMSFTNGFTYYCTIDILQDLHKKALYEVNNNKHSKKPYTLTEMYYAKVVLQHMIHAYLTIKWVQSHVKNNLPPEIVLNFFLQWVDPLCIHPDEAVIDEITELTKLVERHLEMMHPSKTVPIRERIKNKDITQAHVIDAISHVMYKEKRFATIIIASLDTLNIMKVFNTSVGHDVVFAAIYHAIARRFDIHCELISFPNHLFLEWRSQDEGNHYTYKIELDTGVISPKRSCPFSRNYTVPNSYTYCPDSLLQYVISTFLTPLGNYKTWFMQNALYLMDFLSVNHYTDARYNNYLPYLLERTHLPVLNTPIEITNLSDEHLKIIILLSYLTKTPPQNVKEIQPHKRPPTLKYGVGMVCYHRMYDYVCVVRGWENSCREEIAKRPDIVDLQYGPNQPFYVVVAVDQSERYIAQEQIVDVKLPTRMHHLEDMLAKEFTHFNGYTYIPNEHKHKEYPDDKAIGETYRCRAKLYGFNPCDPNH